MTCLATAGKSHAGNISKPFKVGRPNDIRETLEEYKNYRKTIIVTLFADCVSLRLKVRVYHDSKYRVYHRCTTTSYAALAYALFEMNVQLPTSSAILAIEESIAAFDYASIMAPRSVKLQVELPA